MKTTSSKIQALCIVMLFGWVGWSFAASPPERVNIQGVLRDSTGTPVDSSAMMSMRLYDSDGGGCPAAGGTLLLTDDQGTVPVSSGLFNVALGTGTVVPSGIASTSPGDCRK